MILKRGEALVAFVEAPRISLIFNLSRLEAYASPATKRPYGQQRHQGYDNATPEDPIRISDEGIRRLWLSTNLPQNTPLHSGLYSRNRRSHPSQTKIQLPIKGKDPSQKMPLKTGIYTITSELFSNLPLGLDPAEIGSGPKVRRVLALPNFDTDVPAIRVSLDPCACN